MPDKTELMPGPPELMPGHSKSMTTACHILRWSLSLSAGLIAGVVIHYSLYRISLPVEPFIYMAF